MPWGNQSCFLPANTGTGFLRRAVSSPGLRFANPNKIQNECCDWSSLQQRSKKCVPGVLLATIQMQVHCNYRKSVHYSEDKASRQIHVAIMQFAVVPPGKQKGIFLNFSYHQSP